MKLPENPGYGTICRTPYGTLWVRTGYDKDYPWSPVHTRTEGASDEYVRKQGWEVVWSPDAPTEPEHARTSALGSACDGTHTLSHVGSDLHDANLHGAHLDGAQVQGARLDDTCLRAADLRHTYLCDAGSACDGTHRHPTRPVRPAGQTPGHARADHGDHRMTIDLTHLHTDELGMIAYTIRCWAVVLGDALHPVADRVADDGMLTVDDLDGLTNLQLLLVANAVGAWDSTAAGQVRHLAGAAE